MDLTEMATALCNGIGGNSQTMLDPKKASEQLITFSEEVSHEVLRRAGFVSPHELQPNQLALRLDGVAENAPDDMLEGSNILELYNVPASLDAVHAPKMAHAFVFCAARVLDWDDEKERARRVMTYEEAARFILFWFAEKILQIIRKNEWDRVRTLPDLFDRLNSVISAK